MDYLEVDGIPYQHYSRTEQQASRDYVQDPAFMKRANLSKESAPSIKNLDGSVSTHRLAAEKYNGEWYAFPTIIQGSDDSLKEYEDPFEALKENIKTNNVMRFGQDKDSAIEFAKGGYKQGTPMQSRAVDPFLQDIKPEDRSAKFLKDSVVPPEPFNNFETSLAEVENAQKVGLKDDIWTAHPSPEGGLDTIGYGHKITQAEQDAGTYKNGITNEGAIRLFRKDIKKHADIVRKNVKDFDTFPQKYQDILVNIAFNTGSVKENKWPSLLKAMRAGDDKTVREQSITSFLNPQNKRQYLKTRAKKIADAAGLGN